MKTMSNKIILTIVILSVLVVGSFYFFTKEDVENKNEQPPIIIIEENNMFAVLKTNFGDIKLELFSEDAPNTVENFVTLIESDFYDGIRFHRIIKGFMLQGGDPLSKEESMRSRWGTGGPGYTFADEIHSNNKNNTGTISMANAGPNTNGSQFFINTADNNFLDTKHTVFGKVVEGMDVVTKIENTETNKMAGDQPIEDVIINNIEIIK